MDIELLLGATEALRASNSTAWPATGFEFSFMVPYRWVTTVMDLMYPLLVGMQHRYTGGKFPSIRFDGMRRTSVPAGLDLRPRTVKLPTQS